MTRYAYFEKMQNLCYRVRCALAVTRPESPMLADFYATAESGFFQRKITVSTGNAQAQLDAAYYKTLENFIEWVEVQEESAAEIRRWQGAGDAD